MTDAEWEAKMNKYGIITISLPKDAKREVKMNEYGIITISLPKDAKVRTARKEETRRPLYRGRKRTKRIADLNESKA